jgi:hypothetical protein
MKNIRPTRRRLRSPTSPENQPPTKSFKSSSPLALVTTVNSNSIHTTRRPKIKLGSQLAQARKGKVILMSKHGGSSSSVPPSKTALPRL